MKSIIGNEWVDVEDRSYGEFPKIARFNREITISEKIDGTNAQVEIGDDGETITVGSRTKWIHAKDDNAGFANWVFENRVELRRLGPGLHAGEWWGMGINRKYGLVERRFSLFNTHRWTESRPACCGVVPILWQGNARDLDIPTLINKLKTEGSVAVPGWMKPEGIVIYHHASGINYKVLCENDELPKGITTRKEREVAEGNK